MSQDIARPLTDSLRSPPLHIDTTALRQLPRLATIQSHLAELKGDDGLEPTVSLDSGCSPNLRIPFGKFRCRLPAVVAPSGITRPAGG
jgi:hypothetical protein